MAGRSWRDRAPCGTDAGYQRHRYAGQIPCAPCREAHTAEHAERRHLARVAEAGVTPEQWAAMDADTRDDLLWTLRRRPVRRRGADGRFKAVA